MNKPLTIEEMMLLAKFRALTPEQREWVLVELRKLAAEKSAQAQTGAK